MNYFPPAIQNLIDEFNKLPGIGPKTSERFVFYLLKQSEEEIEKFAKAIENLKKKITICSQCYNFSEKDPCPICTDPRRDKSLLCVVAYPQDLQAIEKTNEYKGLYHILGGILNPIEGIGPKELKIQELLKRVKKPNSKIQEIILGLNPDLEGEATAIYLAKLLRPLKIKVARLARGLPMGSDLQYADEVTLSNALEGRKEM
ncbi:MAG: recombination protein RecR [Parcubacteria group bacterium CG23_combo_of_CG06-09_8_20_14_all_35_9]|nr:MAG: recombination protein RecR [Parcubacteria group bacterium CG23_combo_of_CG06-09_8_20_14_all_35_9]